MRLGSFKPLLGVGRNPAGGGWQSSGPNETRHSQCTLRRSSPHVNKVLDS